MFNEKEHKDYETRVELTLKRKEEGLLSPWQISNLVSKMSSYYYKNELLNTISLAIENGIRPNNIFIMDDSFNVNRSYSYVNTFDLNKINDVKNFYHLGVPTSLFPNKTLLRVKLSFTYFSKIYTYLNSKNLDRPDKQKLIDIVDLCTKYNDIEEALNMIKDMAENIIIYNANPQLNKRKLIKKVNEIYDEIYNRYHQFEKEEPLISTLEAELSEGYTDLLRTKDKNYNRIENEYFNKFFKIIADLTRPIVGIYYPETNSIQILCYSFINQQARDNKFIDIKTISHNSPYLICLLIGIAVASPLLKTFKDLEDDRTLENNEMRLSGEDENTREELEEMFDQIEFIDNKPENKSIDNMENDYLKDKLDSNRSKNDAKFNEPISNYNFNNTHIEIKIIKDIDNQQDHH
ncbi:hypothetical protein [Halobacillus sp. A5]|uniref:hypothetical protein n=1 Tax=Halobacillus sp. A5 TaxID=2880263 RepID=UPI0020A69791|nr:hypothetical protein [Halobacillus sp. A5]MCP3026894.1 hypothetical protein [Halobacillus sp. A5]